MHYKYRYEQFFDGIERTDFTKLSGNICIYGAGFQGLLAAHLLDKQGIKVLCFCDMDEKKQGTSYYNLPVYAPEKMKEMYPEATVIVTPYSLTYAYRYVQTKLEYTSVVTPFSLFLEFDTEEFDALPELPDWYQPGSVDYHIDLFMRVCYNVVSDKKMYSADISVTEVCNLKCRDCHSLMPCYEKPKAPTLEEMILAVNRITEGRLFHHFNVEGGEAFTWRYLPEFIEHMVSMPNLLKVYLYTNGTIMPNEKLLRALKHEKIVVRISYYENLTKTEELVKLFTENEIKHTVVLQKWYEFASLSREERTPSEVKRVVETCCKTQPDGNGGPYYISGRLFYCPIQANLHNLGLFVSPERDYVDVLNESSDCVQGEIQDLLNKKSFPVLCKHCYGRAYCGKEVPPAVQLEPGEKISVRFD